MEIYESLQNRYLSMRYTGVRVYADHQTGKVIYTCNTLRLAYNIPLMLGIESADAARVFHPSTCASALSSPRCQDLGIESWHSYCKDQDCSVPSKTCTTHGVEIFF